MAILISPSLFSNVHGHVLMKSAKQGWAGPNIIYQQIGKQTKSYNGLNVALSPNGEYLMYGQSTAHASGGTYVEDALPIPTLSKLGAGTISNDGLYASTDSHTLIRPNTSSAFVATQVATPSGNNVQNDSNTLDKDWAVAASYDGKTAFRTYEIDNLVSYTYSKNAAFYYTDVSPSAQAGIIGVIARQQQSQFAPSSMGPGWVSTSADGTVTIAGAILVPKTSTYQTSGFGRVGICTNDRYGTRQQSFGALQGTPATGGDAGAGVISADGKRIAVISRTGMINFWEAPSITYGLPLPDYTLLGESFQILSPGVFGLSNEINPYYATATANADLTVIALGLINYNRDGVVFVMVKTGNTWALKATLQPGDLSPYAQFGKSLSMSADGTKLAVGSNYQQGPAGDQTYGKVYVFGIQ